MVTSRNVQSAWIDPFSFTGIILVKPQEETQPGTFILNLLINPDLERVIGPHLFSVLSMSSRGSGLFSVIILYMRFAIEDWLQLPRIQAQ